MLLFILAAAVTSLQKWENNEISTLHFGLDVFCLFEARATEFGVVYTQEDKYVES